MQTDNEQARIRYLLRFYTEWANKTNPRTVFDKLNFTSLLSAYRIVVIPGK